CGVDETGSIDLDVISVIDFADALTVGAIGYLLGQRMLVLPAEHFLAIEFVEYLVVVVATFLQDLFDDFGSEIEHLLLAAPFRTDLPILDVLVDRDELVGRNGPRRRRPDDEVPLAFAERELDVDRGILDLVILDLVLRDGRLTPGTLGDRALALLDETTIGSLCESPPRRLHVFGVDGF